MPVATAGQDGAVDTSNGSTDAMAERQHLLDGYADGRSDDASEEPHDGGLRHVDREHVARRRAEAAEHGDGVRFLPHERVHGAGDTESAEEQCDECHEAQVAAEPAERIVEVRWLSAAVRMRALSARSGSR